MIKNVIFDVGRVLVDWTPEATMKKIGCTDEEIELIKSRLFVPGVWDEEDRSVKTKAELEEYFVSLVPELESKVREFYHNATDSVALMPYAHEWIDRLHKAGYGVYILSNFGEESWADAVKRGAINFLDKTDGYLVSYMIHKIKPEAELFEELLKRYSLDRHNCIFIDDTLRNIEGAGMIGMQGILFTGYEDACTRLKELGMEF